MFSVKSFDTRTLSWWYAERDSIDFNPTYQRRGGLWSHKDKAYLVDSILNNYDIPKIYIADFTYGGTSLNEEEKAYAIIDGKQRFEAIFNFYDGIIQLDDEFDFSDDSSLNLGGLSYNDLKQNYPKIARKFDNFNLSVMSVITNEEGKINELFVRLNKSKALTGAEVRSAMKGQVPRLIQELSAHRFFRNKINFSVKRKQDENTVARLLLIEFRGQFVDTKKIHLDRFVEEGIKAEINDFKKSATVVEKVLTWMSKEFNQKDPLLKSSGQIPVYYWFFKNKSRKYPGRLREFLVSFEKQRAKVKSMSEDPSIKLTDELQDYVIYNFAIRNPNDQGSLARCYNILIKKFIEYINH